MGFCLCSVNDTSKQLFSLSEAQWLKLIVKSAAELAGVGVGWVVNDSHSDLKVQSAPLSRMLSEETLKVFINLTQLATVSRIQIGRFAKPSSGLWVSLGSRLGGSPCQQRVVSVINWASLFCLFICLFSGSQLPYHSSQKKVEQLDLGAGGVWENVPQNAGMQRSQSLPALWGLRGWAGTVRSQILCPFKISDLYQPGVQELPLIRSLIRKI